MSDDVRGTNTTNVGNTTANQQHPQQQQQPYHHQQRPFASIDDGANMPGNKRSRSCSPEPAGSVLHSRARRSPEPTGSCKGNTNANDSDHRQSSSCGKLHRRQHKLPPRHLSDAVDDLIDDLRDATDVSKPLVDGLHVFDFVVPEPGRLFAEPTEFLLDFLGVTDRLPFRLEDRDNLIWEMHDTVLSVLPGNGRHASVDHVTGCCCSGAPQLPSSNLDLMRALCLTAAYRRKFLRDLVKYSYPESLSVFKDWVSHTCRTWPELQAAADAFPWEVYEAGVTKPVAPVYHYVDLWLQLALQSSFCSVHHRSQLLAVSDVGQTTAAVALQHRMFRTLAWLLDRAPELATMPTGLCGGPGESQQHRTLEHDCVAIIGRTLAEVLASEQPSSLPAACFMKVPLQLTCKGSAITVQPHPHFRVLEVPKGCPVEQWFRHFLEASSWLSVPVLVRNGVFSVVDNVPGVAEEVLEECASMKCDMFDIPYADAFTKEKATRSLTMEEYLEHMRAQPQSKDYFFRDTREHNSLRFLAQMLNMVPSVMFVTDPPQLAVGSAGTGAPVHFHKPAFNFCFRGTKRWLFFPPENAFWSNRQIEQFINEEVPDLSGACRPLEILQEAGDLCFVPENWGHGVFNKTECVAVAQELDLLGVADKDGKRIRVLF